MHLLLLLLLLSHMESVLVGGPGTSTGRSQWLKQRLLQPLHRSPQDAFTLEA